MADWQASATPRMLRRRAQLLADLRAFFSQRQVMEVETPLLASNTVTDVHLSSFSVAGANAAGFLQTSPEYAMKRLLAGGCDSIFQISKAFRDEPQGSQHNPEFTLLEWYRVGFTMVQLMDEVEALLQQVLDCETLPRIRYKDLFSQHLGIDAHGFDESDLLQITRDRISLHAENLNRTDCMQLLMTHEIEPKLPDRCLVYDYPVAQAALARIEPDEDGIAVAKRFELYCNGMEIANGFDELTDASEQQQRFQQDQTRRAELNLPEISQDQRLLQALQGGLPACSGVALGVDRLLMVITGADSIDEVISFPGDRA